MAGAEGGWRLNPFEFIKRLTNSSEKKKETQVREEVKKHAINAQIESLKQRQRHEEEMRKIELERKTTENKGFKCTINDCGAWVDDDNAFSEHYKEHHSSGNSCQHCDACFIRKAKLEMHLAQHHKEGKDLMTGTCDDEEKVVQDKQQLNSEYKCTIGDCLELFNDQAQLMQHMQQCQHVSKCTTNCLDASLVNNGQLTQQIPQRDLGVSCEIDGCDASFPDQQKFARHVQLYHNTMIKCSVKECEAYFVDTKTLFTHMQQFHTDQFS